jgi:hypothetical protein
VLRLSVIGCHATQSISTTPIPTQHPYQHSSSTSHDVDGSAGIVEFVTSFLVVGSLRFSFVSGLEHDEREQYPTPTGRRSLRRCLVRILVALEAEV